MADLLLRCSFCGLTARVPDFCRWGHPCRRCATGRMLPVHPRLEVEP